MIRSRFRAAVFQVHLWAGLILGVYAFLIGVTGSVLMLREQIVEFIAPAPTVADLPPRHMEEIRNRIQSRYPGWQAWSLEVPSAPGQPWSSYLLRNGSSKLIFADGQGDVVGERDLSGTWFGVVEKFHSNLLLSRGRLYNGIAGLALAFVALTGLFLWWPAPGTWVSALRIVRTSNWKGVVYDVHRVGGALSLVFVLMFSVTGAYFTWPAVYKNIVASVLPVQNQTELTRLSVVGPRKPIDDLAAAARRVVPGGELLRVLVPNDSKTPVRVMFQHGGRGDHATSTVSLNGHTSEIVAVEAYAQSRAGDVVNRLIPRLHTGGFGGPAVKIIWAVAGLALPALFVTGFLMWCNRVVAPRLRRRANDVEPVLPVH